jgi:hypothetical protein
VDSNSHHDPQTFRVGGNTHHPTSRGRRPGFSTKGKVSTKNHIEESCRAARGQPSTELEAIQKGALSSALDSALNVVCETQKLIRDQRMPWTTGERQALAVTLEQMGRLCFSVARECERQRGGAR